MKIVEIIPTLSSGGAERFVVDLCNELSQNNEVTLIILDSLENNGFYASEISSRVKIISIKRRRRIDLSLLFSIKKIIIDIAPDVVHTHIRAIIFSLWTILTVKNIKYFHTVHSDAKKEAKGYIFGVIRSYLFKNQLVVPVTISLESQQSFTNYYGLVAPMIFNGRDIPQELKISEELKDEFKKYRENNETKVIVCLARISPIKRQTLFAKIAKRLNSEGYNFTLLFIGSTQNTELVEQIKLYNCPNIYILGEKHNPLEYLKMSDAYCLCSSHEGMPISLIEAMGVGAIPVCTPVGGVVDVINNGNNGFLSSDLFEESYYETLKRFLDQPKTDLIKMRDNVLKSYTPFSMKECSSKYEKLFLK
ncbi:MAG: glycosyltransferase [Bacteroidales bacterium]